MKIKIFFSLILFLFLSFLNSTKADIFSPAVLPEDLLWSPFTLLLFLGNLIVNFFAYIIVSLFLNVKNQKGKIKILITLFLITLGGFISDSLFFYFKGFISLVIVTLLIFIIDFLIFRYYVKIHYKIAIKFGLCMTILTNPFIYFIFSTITTLILEIFLGLFQPKTPNNMIQLIYSYCSDGVNAIILIRNGGTKTISLGHCLNHNSITGTEAICGSLKIKRTDGGNMSGKLSTDKIEPGELVTFTDLCTLPKIEKNCSYIIKEAKPIDVLISCSGKLD